jgi:hypothetical protein
MLDGTVLLLAWKHPHKIGIRGLAFLELGKFVLVKVIKLVGGRAMIPAWDFDS